MENPNPSQPVPSGPPPAPQLCHGLSIEYKAFSRVMFTTSGAVVICVLANCFYTHSRMSLAFESGPQGLSLMEIFPTGHFTHMDISCSAGWSTPLAVGDAPKEILVRDAYGQHRIPITPW